MVIKTSPARAREIFNEKNKIERANFAKKNAKLGSGKEDQRRKAQNRKELQLRLALQKAAFEEKRADRKYKAFKKTWKS
tara:strand:+ start:406 stop:642 length:237 start_codon:yes stop_codon:yes gene_type:complete